MCPALRQRTLSHVDERPVRERLVAAALEMVQAQGLKGLSQARVAALAGVRQSHLTYYFPTRRDLLKAIVQAIHDDMVATLGGPGPVGSNGTTLAQVREHYAGRIRQPLMARLMLALINAIDEDPSLRVWLAGFNQAVLDELRTMLASAGRSPTDEELSLLHAAFIGAAIQCAHAPDALAAEHAVDLARRAFDRLVTASPEIPSPQTSQGMNPS